MATFSVSSLYQWPRHCTPKAREIVLNVLNASKTPLTTREIYRLAVEPTRTNTPPPHADEAIRSMRYLKVVVLRNLAAQNRVEKVRTQGAFTAWVWRLKQSSAPAPAPTLAASPSPSKPITVEPSATIPSLMELTPAAVGAGDDWAHLNKRRQRARKMKVEKDLHRMLEVQKMQRRAAMQS